MGVPRKAFSRSLKPLYDYLDGVLHDTPQTDIGAIPVVAGLSVKETGAGPYRQTVLTFADVAFSLVDEAAVVAYAGKKVYDFPEGVIKVFGAVANLAIEGSSAGVNDTFDGDFGLGTVTASNNNTLASTEQNIIPTTATPQAVAKATTAKGLNAADIAPLDGTGTAIDLFLNFLVDDADQDVTTTPADLVVNGTIVINWMVLGDK
jgi:hypothetical protein